MAKKEILRVMVSGEDIRESYAKMSRLYPIVEWFEKGVRKRGLELLAVKEGEWVLEIGCATGSALVEIARCVGKRGRVYGLDIASEMLGFAGGRVKRAGLAERVELCQGDAKNMPYRNNMFDAVYTSATLELFDTPDIPKVLGEIKRVLKPSGRLGVMSMSKQGHEDSMILRLYEWIHKAIPKYANCRPIYVEDCIRDAGYKIIKTDEVMIAGLVPMKIVVAKA